MKNKSRNDISIEKTRYCHLDPMPSKCGAFLQSGYICTEFLNSHEENQEVSTNRSSSLIEDFDEE